jgi:[ribosomal protein S18]-alanine N-acetyltransferase
MDYIYYTPQQQASETEKKEVADFLFEHLDQFGDDHDSIMRCINFALDDKKKFGGFIIVSRDNSEVTGAVIVNKTGMEGYIPENILVYIAVHKDYRGQGLGKELMLKTFDKAEGSIKLHVEPENPARYLYEKLGFTSKYLEMRLVR